MDPIILQDSSLEKIYDAGKSAELDIIAVHGLNITGSPDHWRDTWTLQNCNWIQDLLPGILPNTRIYIYMYNSNAFDDSNTFSRGTSFTNRARDFLERVHRQRLRPQVRRRPILFIAHSMGGLLVKTALIWAKSEDGGYWDIATCSKGFATFGTPHRGGDGAMLASTITNALNFLLETPKAKNVLLLQNEAFLEHIAEVFLRDYRETILVSSFYEMRDYRVPGYRVVPKESATLKNGHRERRIGINANHSKMVKFPDGNHPRGGLVLKEIHVLAEKVLQIESAGSPRSIQSNSSEGTRKQYNSFNQRNKATAGDEWEEGSVLSKEDMISETPLSESERTPKPEPEPMAFSAQPKSSIYILNTEPKPRTGSGQPKPSLFWMTCQACRYEQACPEHCLDCRTVRMAVKRLSVFESPPLSSSRLLLSYDLAELCRYHQAKWKRLRGLQHPLSGFSWSANQFTAATGYGHKYPFYSAGYGSKSRQEHSNTYKPWSKEVNNRYGPHYPPPLAVLYHIQQSQKEKAEKESAAKEGKNALLASPSLYGSPQETHLEPSPPSGVRAPAVGPNVGYASKSPYIKPSPGVPDFVYGSKGPHLAYLSHEAPATSSDFQNRLRTSPLPRPRSTQPGLRRRPPSIESLASTATSTTTKSGRTLYSGTTEPMLRRYNPGGSLAPTITPTTMGFRSTLNSAYPSSFPGTRSSANSMRAAREYHGRYQRGVGRRGGG